jgi:hypothetical protein
MKPILPYRKSKSNHIQDVLAFVVGNPSENMTKLVIA